VTVRDDVDVVQVPEGSKEEAHGSHQEAADWHTNRIGSRKLLLKTVETGCSGLANQSVRFCQFW
jgi:hypothetical protein